MKLTSTSCLVGGEVVLPSGGVKLQLWTSTWCRPGRRTRPASSACAPAASSSPPPASPNRCTSRKPFGLTWGEMLADGNLGELDLDFNNWGQRFDGLVFNPHDLTLAPGTAAAHDPYLGVSGSICFPFFRASPGQHPRRVGPAALARSRATSPCPRRRSPRSRPTDLALSRNLGRHHLEPAGGVRLPRRRRRLQRADQLGFIATGTAEFGFLHSDPLVIDRRDSQRRHRHPLQCHRHP